MLSKKEADAVQASQACEVIELDRFRCTDNCIQIELEEYTEFEFYALSLEPVPEN